MTVYACCQKMARRACVTSDVRRLQSRVRKLEALLHAQQRHARQAVRDRALAVRNKPYDIDLVNLAVRQYQLVGSYRRVATLVHVSKSSVQRWVKNHCMTRGGKIAWKKINADVVDSVRRQFEQHPCSTTATIRGIIVGTLHLHLSHECVRGIRVSLGFTRKKVRSVVCKDGLHAKRMAFEAEREHILPGQVISIDETGFYFSMKPAYGYKYRGLRLEVKDHFQRHKHWSLLAAVCNSHILGVKMYNTACDSQMYADFIYSFDTLGREYILMDNASFHKPRIVETACMMQGLEPWYLPPYSPEYQPIERVFSVIKHTYRNQPTPHVVDDDLVYARMQVGLNALTPESCRNFFAYCWAYHYVEL